MLAKKERLSRKDFNLFFASGKRFQSQNFQLVFNKHPTFHGSAVVGKKVFKSAVRRNRLRRQMYGVLYRTKAHTALTGVFILIAKPSAGILPRTRLSPELEALIAQAK